MRNILILVICVFSLFHDNYASRFEKVDSIYTVEIKKSDTTIGLSTCYLLYHNGNETYIAYYFENQDEDMIMSFTGDFVNDEKINYKLYDIYEQAVGTKWSILFIIPSKEFYITDRYDISADGDFLIKEKVNIKNKTAIIKYGIKDGTYLVKLTKLKLLKYKNKR